MKIIAATVALFAALTVSTGIAQADPGQVSVNCDSGTLDLTNAQVIESKHSSSTYPTISSGPESPSYSNDSYSRPRLYIRGHEDLPDGFTAEQYAAQMKETCVSLYYAPRDYRDEREINPIKQPFPDNYVVVLFDVHGFADVAISPTLGITRLMEPHIANFKKAIAAGQYESAVQGIAQAANDEFNALDVAQAKLRPSLQPPVSAPPCDLQESHEISAPAKSFWVSLKDEVKSGDPIAIGGSILAILGGFTFAGIILAILEKLRRRSTTEDDVVDAEVDEDEMKRFNER